MSPACQSPTAPHAATRTGLPSYGIILISFGHHHGPGGLTMIRERNVVAVAGILMAAVLLAAAVFALFWLIRSAGAGLSGQTIAAIGLLVVSAYSLRGFV